MKILPINNTQPQFKANLPKKEINTIIDSALSHDKQAGIPKLYTLLERLDKMPGRNAEIKTLARNNQSSLMGFGTDYFNANYWQLRVDDKLVSEGPNAYDLLYSATTSTKPTDGRKIAMPQAVFDLLWWENREKTAQDIEQFFRD